MKPAARFAFYFCVALSISLFSHPLPARTATGSLEGTVLDAHGNPLPGAQVTIQTSYGTHPHVTHTDASGHFEFLRFATGQYDLRAYHNGAYSDWTKRVTLRATKNAPVTLKLSMAKANHPGL